MSRVDPTLQAEVDQNYSFFKSQLPRLLLSKRGKHALLRHCQIVDFYDDGYRAYLAGRERFSDQLFSVQEVDDRVADLGIFSRI